jgi:hypothetical protein
MMPGVSPNKQESARLFDPSVRRIFDGEAYVDVAKEQIKEDNKKKTKCIAGNFVSRV